MTLADFKSVGVAANAGTGGFDSHTLPPTMPLRLSRSCAARSRRGTGDSSAARRLLPQGSLPPKRGKWVADMVACPRLPNATRAPSRAATVFFAVRGSVIAQREPCRPKKKSLPASLSEALPPAREARADTLRIPATTILKVCAALALIWIV